METARPPLRPFLLKLAPIIVVAGIIRLWAIWYYRSLGMPLLGDPWIYYSEGRYIAAGRGWINPVFYEAYGIRRQLAMHPPAFPLYFAFWALLGFQAIGWFQLANMLVGLALVAAVAFLARRVLGERVALLAALICALSPSLWSFEAMLLAEPLAMLATVCMIGAVLHLFHARTNRAAVIAGLACGLGVLTRAELGLVTGLLLVIVLLAVRNRQMLLRLAIVGVVAGLAVLPWSVHNSLRFTHATPISNGLGVTMAATYCDEATGDKLGYWAIGCARRGIQVAFDQWHAEHPDATRLELTTFPVCTWGPDSLNDALKPGQDMMGMTPAEMCAMLPKYKETGNYPYYFYPDFDDSEIEAQLRSASISWAVDHPGLTARSVAARIGRVVGLYRPGQQVRFDTLPESRPPLWAKWSWATYYLLLLPTVLGAFRLWRTKRVLCALLLAPCAASLVAVALTFGGTRYRAIAEPSMAVFAAVGIGWLWAVARTRWAPDRGSDDIVAVDDDGPSDAVGDDTADDDTVDADTVDADTVDAGTPVDATTNC